MEIGTMSIVVGGSKCNAHCPFCISKMTPDCGVKDIKLPDWQKSRAYCNMKTACRLAEMKGVTTVLITGKGEPTLYPLEITRTLEDLDPYNFPFIELQTNGLKIAEWLGDEDGEDRLSGWRSLGLTTIILSIVHYSDERNAEIYKNPYMNLEVVIDRLHKLGFSVRLSCIMMKTYIDSVKEVQTLALFAKRLRVEQLTIRPVTLASGSATMTTDWGKWTAAYQLSDGEIYSIYQWLRAAGHKLMSLPHGAEVYDVAGQNVCISNCLTIEPDTDNLRQIIVFPDGHIRYDWNYEGAILL